MVEGEEALLYRLPLSSVLSPLVPRRERREGLMQPCLKTGGVSRLQQVLSKKRVNDLEV
jgi:hypothetical protein